MLVRAAPAAVATALAQVKHEACEQILVEILDRDVAPRGPLGQVVGGVQVGADILEE